MPYMRQMKSMEVSDDDKIDMISAHPILNPDFPLGLRISLSEREFEKLDLDHKEAEVGGMVHGHFMGRITSVSQDERDGKACCRVEIQIEDLEIECEDEENEEE
jgi:hypothetical protein